MIRIENLFVTEDGESSYTGRIIRDGRVIFESNDQEDMTDKLVEIALDALHGPEEEEDCCECAEKCASKETEPEKKPIDLNQLSSNIVNAIISDPDDDEDEEDGCGIYGFGLMSDDELNRFFDSIRKPAAKRIPEVSVPAVLAGTAAAYGALRLLRFLKRRWF